MAERLWQPGYFGMGVETTNGTAVTPTDFAEAYDFDLGTDRQFESLQPVAGNIYGTQQVVAGLRKHGGEGTIIFEPNTAEKFIAMMLNQTSRTGGGPYTGVYGLSTANPPGKTYTIDISDGQSSIRYYGCQVSGLSMDVQGNEVRLKPKISALGTFNGRYVTSYTSGTPNVIVLDTTYDPSPTTGLVVGDTIQYVQANGTVTNLVVSVITNGTTFSCTPNATTITGNAAGDWIRLKPLTQSFNMLPPALWSNTVIGFGTTAANALTAATNANQTRLDPGTTWSIEFPFNDEGGEHRTGGQDPASLVRKVAKATFHVKRYYDTPSDMSNFNQIAKSAAVIRHFSYSGANIYETRITFNHLVTNSPIPKWKSNEINYSDFDYVAQMDSVDNQAFAITVINANATLT